MAKLSLQVAKVVGILTQSGWSQVHTFYPEEKDKLLSRGQLLAAVSLAGGSEEKDQLATQGRELITRLHEEYYGELETSALVSLKKAVEKVAREVGDSCQPEIAAAAVVKATLYLAIWGAGRLILARKNKMATILKGEPETNQAVTASGQIEQEDFFLLGTSEFFKSVSPQNLQTSLRGQTADEAVEILAPLIHDQQENSLVAAVVVKVSQTRSRLKLNGFWLFLKNYLSGLSRRTVYLQLPPKKRSKKTLLSVGLMLLFLLVICVFLGRQQRQDQTKQARFTQVLAEARLKKEEGEALIELNPVRAKQLLLEVQSLLGSLESEENLGKDFLRLKEELNHLLPRVLREHEVQPSLFFDLVLIKDNATATKTTLTAEKLVVLDQVKQAVYQLDLVDKKSTILAGGETLKSAFQLAALWPQVFVLTEKGVIQVEKDSKKADLVVEADEIWGEVIDFQVFGGNLYLLTSETIWQYPVAEGGFGSKRNWLNQEIDLTKAVSMTINGSIWVLQTDGTILKLTRGAKEGFGIAGLDKPLSQPEMIFTDSDSENLYFLDKGNSRVVVLEKSGEYHSQYLWEGIKDVNRLAVSEKSGKIFLFQGSQIYEIDIK